MPIKFFVRGKSKGFKSEMLENNIRNLGTLPLLLGKLGGLITGEIRKNLSGRILQKRSGTLHDSWDWTIRAASHGWNLIIGSDVDYAAIHNFGGFTGRNHTTRIKKTRYVDRAVIAKKAAVRNLTRRHLTRISFK